ncbi:unnamed protein product [Chironomus riparius]|uniref:Alpha-macroglobulin receptor-binding domain-containing protein n=1 Tax=Chironomus riparius TaxID=315576 RepID=A0A9N9WUY6_9DIPT|nr:unnamed protein product [Chironomus riparius]
MSSLKMKAFYTLVVLILFSIVNGESEKFKFRLARRSNSGVFEDSADSEEDLAEEEVFEQEPQVEDESKCAELKDAIKGNQTIIFEIILPEIRYMELTKVDVMIYNNINSRMPLNVELNMISNCDRCDFKVYNDKCGTSDSVFPKIISVPHATARLFSFYTQTSSNLRNLNDLLHLKLKASIKSENNECFLTKSVNVKSPTVKTYDIETNKFNLRPSNNKVMVRSYDQSFQTYEIRMATEIIANGSANFTVTLTNDGDFREVLTVTDSTPIEVIFPEGSTSMKTSIKGSGFCTIRTIFQRTVLLNHLNSNFNLTITPLKSNNKNVGNVRVCASFNPSNFYTITNAILDVQMPSGYVFNKVTNKAKIKHVAPRWKNSSVQIYYDDFRMTEVKCVNIQALKTMEVSNAQDAVVSIYDYEDKKNMAVGYYNFLGSCGSS